MATTGTPSPKSKLSTTAKVGIGAGIVCCVLILLAVLWHMFGGASAAEDVTVAPSVAVPAPPALNKTQLLARNATRLHQNLVGFQ